MLSYPPAIGLPSWSWKLPVLDVFFEEALMACLKNNCFWAFGFGIKWRSKLEGLRHVWRVSCLHLASLTNLCYALRRAMRLLTEACTACSTLTPRPPPPPPPHPPSTPYFGQAVAMGRGHQCSFWGRWRRCPSDATGPFGSAVKSTLPRTGLTGFSCSAIEGAFSGILH